MPAFSLPPWLQINPLDYVNSAAAGGKLGLGRAEIDTGANETSAKLANSASEAAGRLGVDYAKITADNAQSSAALSQAQDALKQHMAEAQMENQTKLQLSSDAKSQQSATDALGKTFQLAGGKIVTIQPDGSAKEVYSEQSQPKMINVGGRLVKIQDGNATVALEAQLPPATETTVNPPAYNYNVNVPGTPAINPWIGKSTPEVPARSFSTTNALDLNGLPETATIQTNALPYVKSVTRKVPQTPAANQSAPAAPAQTKTATNTDRFNSEADARSAGKKSGDEIYIAGVGKVRLK